MTADLMGAMDIRVVGRVVDVAFTTGEPAGDTWAARWLVDASPEGHVWVTATGELRSIARMMPIREGDCVECIGVPRLIGEEDGGFFVAATAWRRISSERTARWAWWGMRLGTAIGWFLALVEEAKQRRMKPRDPAERVGRRMEAIR